MSKAQPLIAIVDDEEPVRRAFGRLFRSASLTVETFASGAEFLAALEQHEPDCVVLDLCMPLLSGLALQASLAKVGRRLPVVIVTGNDSPEARRRAAEGGAAAYLRKPVDDKTLLEAVEAAIARVRRVPSIASTETGTDRRQDQPQGNPDTG
ncbi:MAG: response regulator [Tepidisphaeraceae bacterium]